MTWTRTPFLALALACAPTADETADDVVDTAPPAPEPPVFAAYAEGGDVVQDVEPSRYLGTWYEIGTYVIPFQAACTGSTAQYGVVDDDTISVRNRCLLDGLDGDPYVIEGTADAEDDTFTKLSVSFFGTFGSPYWVIERDGREGDAPYEWAIVSGPDDATLWILYREPQMPDVVLDPLLDRLEERGFDLDEISWTEQPEEPFTDEELADAG